MTSIIPDPLEPNLRTWQQALLLSFRLRQAALVLLLFYISSLIASVLPLRMANPAWYLNATNVMIANAPLAITGLCLQCLSLGIRPDDAIDGQRNKQRFQRLCGLLSLLYFSILPLQLLSSSFFVIQFKAAQQSRFQQLQSQQQQIKQRLLSISSIAELNARLAPPPGQADTTLKQRRTQIREALANEQRQFQRTLRQERQQRLLQLLLSSVRIVVMALVTAFFFRMLAKPSDQLLSQTIRKFKRDTVPLNPTQW